ncbi:MAG: peptidase M23 [Bacteroidetes bacterium QH_1_61_8]|nr:MAG: peptidase M23 [Bacteroidetes bacterium QH_1_61_8]
MHLAWHPLSGLPLRLTWTALLVMVGSMLFGGPTHAQERLQARRASTQERLSNLKQQIERSQTQLQKTAKREKATQEELENLEREIALREELVATYQRRLEQLEQERAALRDTLKQLRGRLVNLQEEYQARVRYAYKYNRIPDLALILASRSINQMLVRIRYLQRFAQQRQRQRSEVKTAAAQVQESRKRLEEVIRQLRSRRSELEMEIKQKQSQARELQQQVQEIANKIERRNAQKSESEQAQRAAVAANLSASFEASKGTLPWPADGAITEGFGDQVDPVHGTKTFHPGILIATNPGAQVRSVFEGTVSGVDFVPGYGTYLVVRHGDYLSVYSNFSDLYVSPGDPVEAGQVLGLAGTSEEPRGAGVFFAVFDRSQNAPTDPTVWLANQ